MLGMHRQHRPLLMALAVHSSCALLMALAVQPVSMPNLFSLERRPVRHGARPPQVTPMMHARVDEVMEGVLAGAYDDALQLLRRNRAAFDALLAALLEQTTLDGDEARPSCLPLLHASVPYFQVRM